MARGTLRIYLGAAPGVGKTFAMLNEGTRRARSAAPTSSSASSRPTAARIPQAQIGDLEVVPRRAITYRGATFEEMDVDAVIARGTESGVDRRAGAHQRAGFANEKRWQDVDELLAPAST